MKCETVCITLLLLSTLASASFYSYDTQHPVTVSGQEVGYIKPYQKSGILGTYAYLKYKRYGHPEGNTYPAPLVEGTTVPLPFGLENVYLKVKVNKIQSGGVDLDVNTSQIIPTPSTSIPTPTTVRATTSVRVTTSVQTTTVKPTTTVKQTTTLPSDAKFYSYDSESSIRASGQDVGYIKPYQKSGALGTYAYLKYKREGYPEGNTYPVPLIEGKTFPLPFGLENIYLRVKVYSIRDNGVYLTVDTSEIIPLPTTTTSIPTTSTLKPITSTTLPSDAKFYEYDTKESVYISGLESGYVEPYKKSGVLGTYSYLRYKRNGFSEGTTFPVPLIEGKTFPLLFGLDNIILKVKVYSIQDDGVFLEVGQDNPLPITTTTPPTTTSVSSISTTIIPQLITTTTIRVPASARLYRYDTENAITVNKSIVGYLKPYKRHTALGTSVNLKYNRYPGSEKSYNLAVRPMRSVELNYGSYTEHYTVFVYKITGDGLWADINLSETIPGITKKEEELDLFENQLTSRIHKFVSRGYYTSLHITGKDAQNIDPRVSREMEEMELDIAEDIADTITPLLATLVGQPPLAKAYCRSIKYAPKEMRNDLTKYMLHISTHNYTQHQSDAELSTLGAFTISVGGPSVNHLSVDMNKDLKTLGLPHFEKTDNGTVLMGDRKYTGPGVAVIAAIPEEIIWKKDTIDERWQAGKIRFYRTMIAGLEGEGTEIGIVWYTDQLRGVKFVLGEIQKMACASIEKIDLPTEESDGDDILNYVEKASKLVKNPSQETNSQISETQIQSTMALLQGWYLAGMNLVQEGNFTSVPSAGYVVVIQKQGNAYKLLESHSIMGNTTKRVM